MTAAVFAPAPTELMAAVQALLACGPADGDTRASALMVGDEVRWLGTWHEVMGTQLAGNGDGIYLRLLDRASGTWRTVRYRAGVWVAARPASRGEG